MHFIDTHCHLEIIIARRQGVQSADQIDHSSLLLTEEQITQIKPLVEQAEQQGVSHLINVGTCYADSMRSVHLASLFPQVYATLGIHPCDVSPSWREECDLFEAFLGSTQAKKVVAIGEIGLDYYHKPYNKFLQKEALIAQIEIALTYKKPISFHVREAGEDLLDLLSGYKNRLQAVIHCFSQSLEFAQKVTQWGYFLGLDAPITYPKNEQLREVLFKIPLDYWVLESDSPFLPPVQLRGKENLPAYIPLWAEYVAHFLETPIEIIAQKTTLNAQTLFNIEKISML